MPISAASYLPTNSIPHSNWLSQIKNYSKPGESSSSKSTTSLTKITEPKISPRKVYFLSNGPKTPTPLSTIMNLNRHLQQDKNSFSVSINVFWKDSNSSKAKSHLQNNNPSLIKFRTPSFFIKIYQKYPISNLLETLLSQESSNLICFSILNSSSWPFVQSWKKIRMTPTRLSCWVNTLPIYLLLK